MLQRNLLCRFKKGDKKGDFEAKLADHLKELYDQTEATGLFTSLLQEVEKMDTWTSKQFQPLQWRQHTVNPWVVI